MPEIVPINKGNYSMDTPEREALFEAYRGEGWLEEYQDYRKKWAEAPLKQKVLEYPLLVDIELSSICNLKCPMCYTITPEFKKKVNSDLMECHLFTKIVDEIARKVPAIRLSLRGEATLHKHFIDCIRYAKQSGIREISTLTNGSSLTLEFFKKMVEAGLDWITISADGVNETYEAIRKPLKFNQLINRLRDIKQYKAERNLHKPVIKVQSIWPAIKNNPEEFYNVFAQYSDLVAFNPLIDYLGRDEQIEYEEEFICPQQYQRLVIGADGLAMKCSNDEENVDIIGDVKHETIHGVWHGQPMEHFRNVLRRPKGFMQSAVCQKCYLPRKTFETVANIGDHKFIVRDYVNRAQVIGC